MDDFLFLIDPGRATPVGKGGEAAKPKAESRTA
jgi:hypothetical protein